MRGIFAVVVLTVAFLSSTLDVSLLFAESALELQTKIGAKNQEIIELEKEIAALEKQIADTGKQANTLQNTLKTLELTRKKLASDLAVTQKKIDSVSLSISALGGDIVDKEERITIGKDAAIKSIRELYDSEQSSLLEALLLNEDLSVFWNKQVQHEELQGALAKRIESLRAVRAELVETKKITEAKKWELENLKSQLSNQKKLVEANKADTDKLLRATKSKESEYKKLVAAKAATRAAFELELRGYESELRLIIDPLSIPRTGSGVLSWPISNAFVTQEFGDTDFARSGAYNGNGHNGIDLRASPGTPVKAALSGTIEATGDTDTVCPGASYGKWILIRHANGLSTLYAHLSLVSVAKGQNVATQEIIGYSGITGYATGPHLHFTVYATQGVQIVSKKSRVCSGTYTLPIADLKAYLNPLLYL